MVLFNLGVPEKVIGLPRAGEQAAAHLREMILNGELRDGDTLPRQEDLLTHFGISHPSLREGLRMLEAEGLISIRRGKVGGATVRAPKASGAAYSLGLVLQLDEVRLSDLAAALDILEPICFRLATQRSDRHEKLLPLLRTECERLEESLTGPTFTSVARAFHETVVDHCGNKTLRVTVGALTRLWSHHEEIAATAVQSMREIPEHLRLSVLRTHQRLADLIENGDAEEVVKLAETHLHEAQRYLIEGPDMKVSVSSLPLNQRNAK